mmetsp:Transcript_24433/g.38070  ORF Transcript_24433/g.38070 Transcript_24433/m.38070 type:complete len:174 (-) Transcript_24433:44-565(-)
MSDTTGSLPVASPNVKKRLLRDYKSLLRNPPIGVTAAPHEKNIMHWDAVILGPEGTCFSPGVFYLDIEFSNDYPQKAPKVRFLTKMFHPNIYASGLICLDILQDQWSSTFDVSGVLTSIQSLLADPNPNSPANSEAARMYVEDRGQYERRVRKLVEEQIAMEAAKGAEHAHVS